MLSSFPEQQWWFTLSPTCSQGPVYPQLLQYLILSEFKISASWMNVKCPSMTVSCISLITSEFEHFFICSVHVFCPFSFGLFTPRNSKNIDIFDAIFFVCIMSIFFQYVTCLSTFCKISLNRGSHSTTVKFIAFGGCFLCLVLKILP